MLSEHSDQMHTVFRLDGHKVPQPNINALCLSNDSKTCSEKFCLSWPLALQTHSKHPATKAKQKLKGVFTAMSRSHSASRREGKNESIYLQCSFNNM